MLRVADGRRGDAVLPGHGHAAYQGPCAPAPGPARCRHRATSTLPSSRSIVQFGFGIDESEFDALEIDIQARDAMRGDAVKIGIDKHLSKQRRVVSRHAHRGRQLLYNVDERFFGITIHNCHAKSLIVCSCAITGAPGSSAAAMRPGKPQWFNTTHYALR